MSNILSYAQSCLGACGPVQIVYVNMPVNDISDVVIKDSCGNVYTSIKWSYSTDGICYSCYMSMDDVISSTLNEISDYFVKAKVGGDVGSVEINGEATDDYSVTLDSEFSLDASSCSYNTSHYSPYSNIEGAVQLQTALSNMVMCTIGIPCYYFKANGVKGSADMTFKEYALKSISDVKTIKIIVPDGNMPSSKPEFIDIGLDWQTDWETEISKSEFATAFGNTAQPQEGDLVYIPMMKRMWMVNEAYDEKNGALMWQSTTFRLALVKYQIDASMDLNTQEAFVDSLVANTYDKLFGQDDYSTLDSGEQVISEPVARPANMYPVFKSDATRKEMTCSTIDIIKSQLYHRGTMISDNCYKFLSLPSESMVVYQNKICGDELSVSFIIRPYNTPYTGTVLSIGSVDISISQSSDGTSKLSTSVSDKLSVDLQNDSWHFVTLRFSKAMHTADMTCSIYKYPESVPLYKLAPHHYYFDVDNRQEKVAPYNEEMSIAGSSEIAIHGIYGTITNIKVEDIYNDKLSELMQQYPTIQHLIVNDTARPLTGLLGVSPR